MKKLVVLTGAGMSAESGFETFRDAGGLWEQYPVEKVATPEGWMADPDLVTDFYNGLDERGKTIFKGMVNGKTEREIAADIGISHVATHNRMTKIRTALAAML